MKRVSPIPTILATVGILALEARARADLATIYLKEGEARTVELVSAKGAQVTWKTSASASEIQTTMRSQISHVLFPTTQAWREAELAMETGDLSEAIKLYKAVVKTPGDHYFPIPGNYSSLAKERILQCYRLQKDATNIAKQAAIVREEFINLPPDLKQVAPETTAWIALTEQKWQKIIDALDEVETPVPETFFLRGRAYEGLGDPQRAITEYAGAYVLNFGGTVKLTREALQRSASLAHQIGDKDRIAELQAQVKIYRDLYGTGQLWSDAPEKLVALADGEIKPLGEAESEMSKPGDESAEMAGTVVEESAAVATLVPPEDRPFLLAEELSKRVFLIGKVEREETITLNGGVKKEGEAYVYDGTGGQIVVESADLNRPYIHIQLRFETEQSDAILVHCKYDRLGGFSIYLKEGQLLMDWAPKRKDPTTAILGKIEPGLTNLSLIFRTTGARETTIGRDRFDDQVSAGGLTIVQPTPLKFGNAEKTISGAELPAFKGTLHHLSFVTAENSGVARERMVARFGKEILLLPPLPSEEEEDEESSEEQEAE